MTDGELKKKCTERAKIFQQAMENCHSSSPIDCIEWFADRIAELEAQIEKMKADVRVNIKVADQSNNCLMYQKLNSMLNQWEGKRR